MENFVMYGPVDRKTVKELISKRGQLRVEGGLKIISSNQVVEDVLGKLGVVCVEDIVGEIAASSDASAEIQKHLA